MYEKGPDWTFLDEVIKFMEKSLVLCENASDCPICQMGPLPLKQNEA